MPHSRALEHSAAQTLLAALPWSDPAPWPGFKAPPSELSPLSPHLRTSALPEPLSECSPSRNPIHYSLFSSISRSPPPGSLLTPSPSPVALYLHPPNDFARQADFGIYILKMRKQGTERLSNWPKTTQLESAGIWI